MNKLATTGARRTWWLALRKIGLTSVMIVGLTLLLLLLAGKFEHKVGSERPALNQPSSAVHDIGEVRLVKRQRTETAVGTIRAVHESAVASKLLAKVVEVRIRAGQTVGRDEILVRLDDADLQARMKQAQANEESAKAALEKASADYERIRPLADRGAASQEELDRAVAARRSATAEVERGRHLIQETKALLDYATIRAPISGMVVDKRIEAGDTASPGQVLLTLYDPTRMQMVVSVREALAQRLTVGTKVRGRLDALNLECDAQVSEIVPEAHAASRSFTVKVTGPCPSGAYTGMFGRIMIPLEDEEVLAVPMAAVRRVGQLELVDVWSDRGLRRRSVQLGRVFDVGIEVLSGLRLGDRVVLYRPANTGGARP